MQTIRYRTGVNRTAWPLSPTRERQQTQRRCTIDKVRFCLSHLIYGTLSNHLYLIHAGNNYCEGVDGLAGAGKKRRRGQRYNTARTASVHLGQAIIIFRRRSSSLTVTMGTMWSRTLLIHYLMWNVRWKWNFCNNCSRILSIAVLMVTGFWIQFGRLLTGAFVRLTGATGRVAGTTYLTGTLIARAGAEGRRQV